jgi:hypothetical protein
VSSSLTREMLVSFDRDRLLSMSGGRVARSSLLGDGHPTFLCMTENLEPIPIPIEPLMLAAIEALLDADDDNQEFWPMVFEQDVAHPSDDLSCNISIT